MDASVINDLVAEYLASGITDEIDYEKFYRYSVITHSTSIEGSTMTQLENQQLFDHGIVASNRSIDEQNMNLDCKEAYDVALQWATSHKDYSVDFLCRLSARIMRRTGREYNTMGGTFDSSHGDLRLCNVNSGFGTPSYTSYLKVPTRLKEFCLWLNEQRKGLLSMEPDRVYAFAYSANEKLVAIHPWVDGNGRISRMVMNMIEHEAGLPMTQILPSERVSYIQALIQSRDQESSNPFIDAMTAFHTLHLRQELDTFYKNQDKD